METKRERYEELMASVRALIDGETDSVAVMATIACALYHAFDYVNWAGFYRRVEASTLKVGPYQGTHGCLTIDVRRGVCGKCVREKQVQLENDVTRLPFHIACSSETRAEIVVPVFDAAGEVRAVLDVDSVQADVFDEADVTYLSALAALVAERLA